MGDKTTIEWVRGEDGAPGATWNPTRGCSRVSAGCQRCYAESIAARFSGPGKPFAGFAERNERGAHWTGRVELVPSALDLPLRWRKPRRVFVNSMSDLFHEKLSNEDIAAVFGVMAACPQHTFQVLTKRAKRMREWFTWVMSRPTGTRFTAQKLMPTRVVQIARGTMAWPFPNVWLGVSVEDQATADERIPHLLATPAAVRFVSYEPALGPVDFSRWLPPHGCMHDHDFSETCVNEAHQRRPSISWLIVGGESGHGARPFSLDWARSTIAQCRAAGVAVFVKQLGGYPVSARVADAPGAIERDVSEWPEDLRVREMPRTA